MKNNHKPHFFLRYQKILEKSKLHTIKTYIPNFQSIAQKLSELLYLKDDPKFGAAQPLGATRKKFPPTVSGIITYTNGGSQVS